MKLPAYFCLIAILALTAGVWIGKQSRQPYTKPPEASPQVVGKHRSATRQSAVAKRRNASSSFEYKMERIITHAGGYDALANEFSYDYITDVWSQLRTMDSSELSQAIRELNQRAPEGQGKEFLTRLMMMQWGKKDPHAAMDYVFSDDAKPHSEYFKRTPLLAWVHEDGKAAYKWYLANKTRFSNNEIAQTEGLLIPALAKKHLDLALEALKDLDSTQQSRALQFFQGLSINTPERRQQFIEFINGLEDEDIKFKSTKALIRNLAHSDPQKSLELFDSWRGKESRILADTLAHRWSHNEPEKAMEWRQSQIQTGEDPTPALASVFDNWVKKSPDKAKAWLDQQTGVNKDTLRHNAAYRMLLEQRHLEAMLWTSRIEDQKKREMNYRHAYTNWKNNDREAAHEWFSKQPASLQTIITSHTP